LATAVLNFDAAKNDARCDEPLVDVETSVAFSLAEFF
jgi:hypothetical protein